jgi:hypothetical protein
VGTAGYDYGLPTGGPERENSGLPTPEEGLADDPPLPPLCSDALGAQRPLYPDPLAAKTPPPSSPEDPASSATLLAR